MSLLDARAHVSTVRSAGPGPVVHGELPRGPPTHTPLLPRYPLSPLPIPLPIPATYPLPIRYQSAYRCLLTDGMDQAAKVLRPMMLCSTSTTREPYQLNQH